MQFPKLTNFNNLLAVFLEAAILVTFALQGAGVLATQGEVNGALIAVFTLIAQFYFRKAPTEPPKT